MLASARNCLGSLSRTAFASQIAATSQCRKFSTFTPKSIADTKYTRSSGIPWGETPIEEFTTADGLMESCTYNPAERAARFDETGRVTAYMMTAASKAVYFSLGRMTVHSIVGSLSASADVVSLASLEVDLAKIDPGTNIVVKWRGKPVFLKHRTAAEIKIAKDDDSVDMRDKQSDSARVQKDQYLVVIGICTHLGCVPVHGLGDFPGGYFCPCHGSHYDASGRIRKGPAPLNLEVPPYKFVTDTTVLIG